MTTLMASLVTAPIGAAPNPADGEAAKRHHVPILQLRYFQPGTATLAGNDGDADLFIESHVLQVTAMFGHRFASAGTVVAVSAGYDLAALRLRRGVDPATDATLHALRGRLALMQPLDETWGSLGFVRAGIASDFTGIGWADLRLSTGGAVSYRWDAHWQVAVGALYTNAFFSEMILPLVHLRFRSDPYRLNVTVPRGAEGWYAPARWLELGMVAGTVPLRFGIHDPPSFADEYGQLNVYAGAAARVYPYAGFFVAYEGGYVVRYHFAERDGEKTHEVLLPAGPFAAVSVGYMY